MEKKKLLFVIESLTLAGSEKSLIALLSHLDPEKYFIDLQLFRYGGELEKFIPTYVNVLPALSYTEFVKQSLTENIQSKKIDFLLSKLNYSLRLRLKKRNHSEIAKLYWQSVKGSFSKQEKKYDVAIAFAQGVPTFYVSDKINAKKKITWVNANMQFTKNNIDFQRFYYSKYDRIVSISKGTCEHMGGFFTELKSKFTVIPNIIDYQSICRMANDFKPDWDKNICNILTVGRLDDGMKGMDITIESCKVLKEKNIDFHWYIVGEGSFRKEMEAFIKENQLGDLVSLVGSTDNPYPYFSAADLYVQTSRHEGYGRTIAEARMLNVPIVTTNFDTIKLQIEHLKNGIITDMNSQAVAEGIIKIMEDKNLYAAIKESLTKEQKENTETVLLFDQLIAQI